MVKRVLPGLSWMIAIMLVLTAACFCISWSNSPVVKTAAAQPVPVKIVTDTTGNSLYASLKLDSLGLSKEAFNNALYGYNLLDAQGKLNNDQVLSIVDFSLPSSHKRLFVIDVKNSQLLFNTYVSHGRGSGTAVATQFSNDANSYKSSLGFYVTGETYSGKHGYSLRLNGQEKGINDNALSRGIVMHSAAYVDERFATDRGYIGRSQGCPAVPEKLHKAIIQAIRNGSCLFMYSSDKSYAAHSSFSHNGATA